MPGLTSPYGPEHGKFLPASENRRLVKIVPMIRKKACDSANIAEARQSCSGIKAAMTRNIRPEMGCMGKRKETQRSMFPPCLPDCRPDNSIQSESNGSDSSHF